MWHIHNGYIHRTMLVIVLILLYSGAVAATTPLFDASLEDGSHGKYPTQRFVSTELTAPVPNFAHWDPLCDDGRYYMITPRGDSISNPSTTILDARGNLVWTSHFPNNYGGQTYDLRVHRYRDQDYLTFWVGDDRIRGHGQGHFYMLNSSYDLVREITTGNGMLADLHELEITPEGTALMIIYQVVPLDVRPAGRKFADVWNQAIWDCLVQEIDIGTQKVKFEWRASEHINITDSYQPLDDATSGTRDNPYDPFHMNSVQKDAYGNYLMSIRNTHAIYYIDGHSGNILWTLGGKSNNFMDLSDGRVLQMAWQHHARFVDADDFTEIYKPSKPSLPETFRSTLLTVFDNAAKDYEYQYGTDSSRGLLLEIKYPIPESNSASGAWPVPEQLNPPASMSVLDAEKVSLINGKQRSHTARLIQEYINPARIRSGTQGSMQAVTHKPHGRSTVLLGYGLNAVFTEFTANGSVLCDIHFAAKKTWETAAVQSYRVFKQAWIGRPRVPPSVAFRGHTVLVSWNGATQVHTWALQGQSDDGEWSAITQATKAGFETALQLPPTFQHIQNVRCIALDAGGEVLEHGTSKVVARSRVTVVLTNTFGQSSGFVTRVITFVAMGGVCLLMYYLLLRFMSWRMSRKGTRYPILRR